MNVWKVSKVSRFTQESAQAFLDAAGVFYEFYPDDEELDERDPVIFKNVLNMNDVWGWALAWGEKVPDEKLIEVAELFWAYGWPGLLYWMSCRHDNMRSEFHDNNRAIEFVRNEERIKAAHPGSSALAYHQEAYTIGNGISKSGLNSPNGEAKQTGLCIECREPTETRRNDYPVMGAITFYCIPCQEKNGRVLLPGTEQRDKV